MGISRQLKVSIYFMVTQYNLPVLYGCYTWRLILCVVSTDDTTTIKRVRAPWRKIILIFLWPNPQVGEPCSRSTRAARIVSSHFKYLENRSRGLDVTWQPARGDLTVQP